MKKMCFLAYFALCLLSAPTKVWGTDYIYKCAPTKVTVARTTTSSPYKYTLTITQNTQKTSSGYSTTGTENNEVIIILTSSSPTLEGEYNNETLAGTYYSDLSAGKASLNTSQFSSFKIIRNNDGSYQISDGTIYTKHTNGNQRIFYYCYESVTTASVTKGDYTFFPNWDTKYNMSDINTFNAVYNSANNGYDISFKATGTNNAKSSETYTYTVTLHLKNASDFIGTFRTGTATNELLPTSTIVSSGGNTRKPIEFTSLTISQVAPNQYKLAGKLYALITPSGTNTPYLYDFGDGIEFTFNAINYNFSENGENNPSLEEIADKKLRFDLTLGRTLSDEYYNTFCSPIAISADEVENIFGEGTDIRTLESSSYDAVQNQLTLTFSENSLSEIAAGKPYLIKPGKEVTNPQFNNVATSRLTTTAQTIETTNADFYGILEPYTLSAADPTFLFLAANNQLMWGDKGTLNGMRAYFKIKNISDIQQASKIPARMQFGSKTISTDLEKTDNAQGTMRNGKYMYNGHLVIVHNGKKYNL